MNESYAAAIAAEYDAVLYDGSTFEQAHPDHLAAMMRLFGLEPPNIATGRVLELGCASGENLIPMATQLPGATFYGVDLSGRQIAAGCAVIEAVGLTNIRLEQRDLTELGVSDGPFDVIICHGVYSWVPRSVQAKILPLIRAVLAPNGVAFVSYNVFPGWHERLTAREIMRYLSRGGITPAERLERARRGLDFVARAALDSDAPYAHALRAASTAIQVQSDGYVFHEHLESDNEPLWFQEFWDQLGAAGLAYLTDTHLGNSQPLSLPPETRAALDGLAPDLVSFEQVLDFLRNRPFRQSLIVHGEHAPARLPQLEALDALHVIGAISVVRGAEDDVPTTAPMTFLDDQRTELTSAHPAVKALLWEVCRAGQTGLPMLALREHVLGHWRATRPPPSPEDLSTLVLRLVCGRSIALRFAPPPVASTLSATPEASAITRYFAALGESVPNHRHRQVVVTGLAREVLLRLDGARTLDAVSAELAREVEGGRLQVGDPNRPPTGATLRFTLKALTSQLARQLLRDGLLVR